MATNKKNAPAATASAASGKTAVAAPAARPASKGGATKSAAKPAAGKPAPKPASAKAAAGKAAKALDPAVQASKEALAKALAAAQAVKIEKPLGKPAKADKGEKPAKAEKAPKARKAKLVRDSFTMPEDEYAQIAELKKRLLAKGMISKKSELLRAGVALLADLGDAELAAAMKKVEVIKTGRPAKSGK